ncbi:unnamed protein product [Pylaiella littoralis]
MMPKQVGTSFFSLLGLLLSCSRSLGQVELPPLGYDQAALEPYISNETVSYHYGKHHQGYVNNVNGFIEEDPSLANLSLWKLMKKTEGTIFNNVGQVYNHNVYWESLSPDGGDEPTGDILDVIVDSFGSYDAFKDLFTSYASGHFGSGWAWLILLEDGSLDVVDTHDASNPVVERLGFPLLVCDVWEHAYYIDYRNLRADYIDGWWNLVNWERAQSEYNRVMAKWARKAEA